MPSTKASTAPAPPTLSNSEGTSTYYGEPTVSVGFCIVLLLFSSLISSNSDE
jgi:hypothetical protein